MAYHAEWITPKKPLEIQGANGSFELRGEEINEPFVDLRNEEGMDQKTDPSDYIDMLDGEKLIIRLNPDEARKGRTVRIHLPKEAEWNTTIRTSNGSIKIDGLSGIFDVTSSNGRIRLSDTGGTVQATCANGSVEGKNLEGKLDISTSNGKITIRESRVSEGSFKSGNGKISAQIEPTGSGTLSMLSGNGKIKLALPEDSGYRIQVETKGKLYNHLDNYSVQTEGDATILEKGSGEYSILIQNYRWGVSLVKYEEFDKAMDEDASPFNVEDMGEFFQNLFGGSSDPRDFKHKMQCAFDEEFPRIMKKMAHFGTRFGKMGEEISRKFHEKPKGKDEEIRLILDMLQEGKISAEEAERLIKAIKQG